MEDMKGPCLGKVLHIDIPSQIHTLGLLISLFYNFLNQISYFASFSGPYPLPSVSHIKEN